MGLSFEKMSLLTMLNGVQTVEQICGNSTLSDFEVCRCLWAYRVIGVTHRVEDEPAIGLDLDDEGLSALLEEGRA
jgi:hypothetical protein